MHDWFSKTGQGVGTEYRYNIGATATATSARTWRSARDATRTQARGSTEPAAATTSAAAPARSLPFDLARARERELLLQHRRRSQTFNNATSTTPSRNNRSFGGNLVGAWGKYSLNATFDHSEYFYNLTLDRRGQLRRECR